MLSRKAQGWNYFLAAARLCMSYPFSLIVKQMAVRPSASFSLGSSVGEGTQVRKTLRAEVYLRPGRLRYRMSWEPWDA